MHCMYFQSHSKDGLLFLYIYLICIYIHLRVVFLNKWALFHCPGHCCGFFTLCPPCFKLGSTLAASLCSAEIFNKFFLSKKVAVVSYCQLEYVLKHVGLNVKSYNKHINIQDCEQCLFSSYMLNITVNKCVGNILCCLIAIHCFHPPVERLIHVKF